jgi:hypothetical protein
MKAFALLFVLAVFTAGVAYAAPVRDTLIGFNGIAFGTTFEAAKELLGVGAKPDTDARKNNILLDNADFFGENSLSITPSRTRTVFRKAMRSQSSQCSTLPYVWRAGPICWVSSSASLASPIATPTNCRTGFRCKPWSSNSPTAA